MTEKVTNLRLSDEVMQRAERLSKRMASDPVAAALAGSPPSRAAVLRLAIARGLAILEHEYGLSGPSPPS